jgi:poly(3-hydroxyalkanoate) depolymerase
MQPRLLRAPIMTPSKDVLVNEQHLVSALGQQIRVDVRQGIGVPLVMCNGIGTSLEVFDPILEHLHPDTTLIRFDVPGTGGSPNSAIPYGFPYLAIVLARVLKKLSLDSAGVDVLGLSWGGALAQQFAFQYPRRCRRLILVSTATGCVMVPGKPRMLAKMLTPRRLIDGEYAAAICADLYGGSARTDPELVNGLLDRQLMAGSRVGYVHQLIAGAFWTSIFALPLVRQPTLIIAGTDDPIIPLANARLMSRLLPRGRLHVHSGGHVDLILNAAEMASVIESFRKVE